MVATALPAPAGDYQESVNPAGVPVARTRRVIYIRQYSPGRTASAPGREALIILWPDNQHRLIADDTLFFGTINMVTLHSRSR